MILKKGFNVDRRLIIGKYVSQQRMHPNDNYKTKYPSNWERTTKNPVLPGNKKLGLFAAVSAIVETQGIHQDLIDIFDNSKTNAILDYAMFTIGSHTDATEQYEAFMHDKVLFADKVRNDSWYSTFFKEDISASQSMKFKNAWAKRCQSSGIESVYLCIDGSNNDCSAGDAELAENGNAKSHKNTHIISYMYVVSEKDGTPVTYAEYRGGEVDSKGIKEIITFLKSFAPLLIKASVPRLL